MEHEKYYHIYNRANGRENLFQESDNYRFFLQQWSKYVAPVANTFAYCLMPNHIHFLIQILPVDEIKLNFRDKFQQLQPSPHPTGFKNLSGVGGEIHEVINKLISKQFSNLFNSYSKAYNKKYNRSGSLFQRPFKRKEVTSEDYYKNLICYIHRNPIHHRFCKSLEDWKYSSYPMYVTSESESLFGTTIAEWFEDKANFIGVHQQQIELLELDYFID